MPIVLGRLAFFTFKTFTMGFTKEQRAAKNQPKPKQEQTEATEGNPNEDTETLQPETTEVVEETVINKPIMTEVYDSEPKPSGRKNDGVNAIGNAERVDVLNTKSGRVQRQLPAKTAAALVSGNPNKFKIV